MNRTDPEILDYYDNEIVKMLSEKYGFAPMESLRRFLCSKTHQMLEDGNCGLTDFGAGAILEIWEAEQIAGDPRVSVYIREE